MINKLKIDGVNKTLTEDDLMPYTYTFTKAQVHTVNFGLDNSHEICAYAFDGCKNLTSIEFPDEVTMIKRYAFRDCVGLKSMVVPSTINYIGKHVFDGCTNLSEVTFKSTTPPSDYYADLPTKTISYVPDNSKYKVIDYADIDATSDEQYFYKTDWNQYIEINDKAGIDPLDVTYTNSWKIVGDDKHIVEEKNRVPVQDIEFDETTIKVYQGQKFKLSYTLVPENATNYNLTWIIKNQNLLTISDADLTGQIEFKTTDIAKNYGDTKVTVYAESGQFKVLTFKVAKSSDIKAVLVTSISLSDITGSDDITSDVTVPNSVIVNCTEGDKFKFVYTIAPDNADNKEVEITCDDSNVVIGTNGEITIKSSGTYYLKVKAKDESGVEAVIKIIAKTEAFITLAKAGYNNEYIETLGESGAPETVDDDVIWFTSQRFGIKIDDVGGKLSQVIKDLSLSSTSLTDAGNSDQLEYGVVKINNKGKWYEFQQPANAYINSLDLRMLPNKLKAESVGSWLGFDPTQVKLYDINEEKYIEPITINVQEYSGDFASLTEVHQETILKATCNSNSDFNASHYRVEIIDPSQPFYIICGDGTDTNANAGTTVSITEKKDRINDKTILASNKAIYANIAVYGTTWDVDLVKLDKSEHNKTSVDELSGLCDTKDHSALIGVSDKGSIYTINYNTGESTVLYTGTGEDIEAVTMDADGNIYYVNEADNSIMKMTLTDGKYSNPVKVSRDEDNLQQFKKDPTDSTADGFEGITWLEGDTFILANQKKYKTFVKYSLSTGIISSKETYLCPELADVVYNPTTKHLYVLCSDQSYIYEIDEDYKVVRIYKLPIIAVRENPEALWIDFTNEIFFVGCDITKNLYVVPFNEARSYTGYDYGSSDSGSDEGSVDSGSEDVLYIETITAEDITEVEGIEKEVTWSIYPPAPDDSTVIVTCDSDKVTIKDNKVTASEAGEYTLKLSAKKGTASTTIKFTATSIKTFEVGSIVFNEIDPNNKKVEFYNTTDTDLSLDGLVLKGIDETGASRDNWSFSSSDTIKAHDVYVITFKSTETTLGPSYGLSATKNWTLSIVDGKETVIDTFDYVYNDEKYNSSKGGIATGTSYARIPDGTDTWVICTTPTIGKVNYEEDPITITGETSVLVKSGDPINLIFNITNKYDIKSSKLTCDDESVIISGDNQVSAIENPGEYIFTFTVVDINENTESFNTKVKVYEASGSGITATVEGSELTLTDADATVEGTELTIVKDSFATVEGTELTLLEGSSELTTDIEGTELTLSSNDTNLDGTELTITNNSTVTYDETSKTLTLK